MGYPQAPWRFQGLCMAIFYLVPIGKAKTFVPEPFEINEVLPGMTLGGLFAARYTGGDLGAMSEFGVMPAYVRYLDRKGFYMHNFSVDSEDAKEGCRKIWGVDKGISDFSWDMGEKKIALDVSSGGVNLISLKIRPLVKELPFTACFPFLSIKGKNVVSFQHHFASRIGLATSTVRIPDKSPLKGLPLRMKLISAFWDASNIVLKEPEYITEKLLKHAENAFGNPVGRRP